MEIYDPEKHGEIVPIEDDLPEPIRNLRPSNTTPVQAPDQTQGVPQEPQGGVPEGFHPYNPEVDGEIIPAEQEEGFWSKAKDAVYRGFHDLNKVRRMGIDAAVGAIYEGPRRVVSQLSNASDALVEKVTGYDPGAAREKVTGTRDIGVPYTPLESETAVELGATLGPSIVGGGLAGATVKFAPKVIKFLAGTLGASGGYAASKTPGADRVLIGKDSLAGEQLNRFFETTLFDGLPEEDAEGREKRMNIFLNDFADAVAIALPTERVADMTVRVSSALWNAILKPAMAVMKSNRQPGLEEALGLRLVEKLRLAQGAETPQQRARMIQEAAQMIRENSEILLKVDEEDLRLVRDTMSSIEIGADNQLLKERARSVRAGGGPSLDEVRVRMAEPARQTERVIDENVENLGGIEGINRAGEGIQEQAEAQFQREFQDPIRQTEEALEMRNKNLDDIFQSDPRIASSIQKLDDAVDIDIAAARDQSIDEMRSAIRQGYDILKAEGDEILKTVPHQMVDFSDDIELIRNGKIPTDVKKLFEVIEDENGKVMGVQGDFKELYQKAVPKLSAEINRIRKTGSGDISDLVSLRDAITDKIETEGIIEADEFVDWYKNKWAPIFKDGTLEDFANVYQMTQARGPGIRPTDYAAETANIISKSMKNKYYAEHVRNFLATPEAGGRPELVTDFILGDIAAQLQSQLNAGKTLKEIDLSTFTKTLEDYGSVLKKVDPEGYERVNSFLTKLRSTKGDIKSMEDELNQLQKRAEKGEKVIFDRDYKEFFNTRVAPISGAKYESFDKLLKSEDSTKRIAQILDRARADGRQDIIDGMKAAYLRSLKDEFFLKNKPIAGAKGTNFEKVYKAQEGVNNVFENGRQIFSDQPALIDGIESLFKETARISETLEKTPQMTIVNFDEFARQSSVGIDKIITLTLGVLNRAAARARALKGTVVEYTNPDDLAREVFGRIMAEPEYAASILERIAAKEARGLTPQTRRSFEDWIVFVSPNIGEDELQEEADHMTEVFEETPLDNQTREALR